MSFDGIHVLKNILKPILDKRIAVLETIKGYWKPKWM